MKKEIRGI